MQRYFETWNQTLVDVTWTRGPDLRWRRVFEAARAPGHRLMLRSCLRVTNARFWPLCGRMMRHQIVASLLTSARGDSSIILQCWWLADVILCRSYFFRRRGGTGTELVARAESFPPCSGQLASQAVDSLGVCLGRFGASGWEGCAQGWWKTVSTVLWSLGAD